MYLFPWLAPIPHTDPTHFLSLSHPPRSFSRVLKRQLSLRKQFSVNVRTKINGFWGTAVNMTVSISPFFFFKCYGVIKSVKKTSIFYLSLYLLKLIIKYYYFFSFYVEWLRIFFKKNYYQF